MNKLSKLSKIDHPSFDIEELEVGKEYQYKEGGIIFNFKCLEVFEDDKKWGFKCISIDEQYKCMGEQDFSFSKEKYYYSGQPHIMNKNTYMTGDGWKKWQDKNNNLV